MLSTSDIHRYLKQETMKDSVILRHFPHSATTRDEKFIKQTHKRPNGDYGITTWRLVDVIQQAKASTGGANAKRIRSTDADGIRSSR